MFKKMILVGLISMVPIIELRGAIPYAVLWDAQPLWLAILIAVIGNMIPVPFIFLMLPASLSLLPAKPSGFRL